MLVIYPLMERKYTTFSLTVSHPEAWQQSTDTWFRRITQNSNQLLS